jgi:hypothetical protein
MQSPPEVLEVRADGNADAQALADVAKEVADGATDVLVLAHGWNETRATARDLYGDLTRRLCDAITLRPVGSRTFAAIGVVWPAVRWADGDRAGGGAASVGDDVLRLHETIIESSDRGAGGFADSTAAELRALTTVLDTRQGRARFVETLRRRLPDPAEVADDDALPEALLSGDPEELFAVVADADGADLLADDDLLANGTVDGEPLAVPGGAAGFGFPDLSPLVIARRLINLTSYYTMKERSGNVGTGAVARLVETLHGHDVRVHLAGHSFGARVAASAATASQAPVASMTLLQGAFSHVGFAPAAGGRPAGAFRRALTGGVDGPVVATHTHNDRIVTLAYAIASRVARQVGSGIGDADDPYGGVGANGAVATPEAVQLTLGAANAGYAFAPRRIHNLRSDRFVAGHNDIRGREVANAMLQVMLAG